MISRGVAAGLERYLRTTSVPFGLPGSGVVCDAHLQLQRYAPGEGFKQWHCDWTISDEATEPVHRVLAWILYCDTVEEAGTEFHWQNHHEPPNAAN